LAPGGVLVFQLPSHLLESDEQGQRFPSLDDDAFRAEILPADSTLEIEAGSIAHVRVGVRNASTSSWADDRFVNLGNHWRGADGSLLRLDDGRTSMRATVSPGNLVALPVERQAPADPGAYRVR